jgi:hypothetical protein
VLSEVSTQFLEDAVLASPDRITWSEPDGKKVLLEDGRRHTAVTMQVEGGERGTIGRPATEGAVKLVGELPPGARGLLTLQRDGTVEVNLLGRDRTGGAEGALERAASESGMTDVRHTRIPTESGVLLPVVHGKLQNGL